MAKHSSNPFRYSFFADTCKIGDRNRATSVSYELVWKMYHFKEKILDHL